MRRILIFILLTAFLSCKEEKSKQLVKVKANNKNDMNVNSIDTIKKITEQQVLHGYAIKEAGLDMEIDYDYKKEDYDVIKQISLSILKSYNYKTLNTESFQNKVSEIFSFKNVQKDVNFLIEFACPLEKIKYQLDINYTMSNNNPLFIDSKNRIILEALFVPQLVNYKVEYPDIHNKEKKIESKKSINGEFVDIIKWKEIPNLDEQRKKNIQLLVARNMYLFNDSRAYFKWLILNDQNFMQSLVTTFGYYEDKELLKWGVENTKFDKDNPQDLDKLFWNKKCDGTVKLNLEIFPVLKEIIKRNGTDYFEPLKQYVMYLLTNKQIRNELSIADRAKLLAYLVHFGEQYRYDKNYNDQSYFMQRIELFDLDGTIEKEIERNNFYNLPNYKNLYKKSEEYQNALTDENGG